MGAPGHLGPFPGCLGPSWTPAFPPPCPKHLGDTPHAWVPPKHLGPFPGWLGPLPKCLGPPACSHLGLLPQMPGSPLDTWVIPWTPGSLPNTWVLFPNPWVPPCPPVSTPALALTASWAQARLPLRQQRLYSRSRRRRRRTRGPEGPEGPGGPGRSPRNPQMLPMLAAVGSPGGKGGSAIGSRTVTTAVVAMASGPWAKQRRRAAPCCRQQWYWRVFTPNSSVQNLSSTSVHCKTAGSDPLHAHTLGVPPPPPPQARGLTAWRAQGSGVWWWQQALRRGRKASSAAACRRRWAKAVEGSWRVGGGRGGWLQ